MDIVCQDCYFAKMDGTTQIDCARGMLDKHRDSGANVQSCYNEKGEFFIVEGRTCRFKRRHKWAEAFNGDNEQLERILSLEVGVTFHVIIFADKSLEDIKTTLYSLTEQQYKPAMITVILGPNSGIDPKEAQTIFDRCPSKWNIRHLLFDQDETKVIHMVHKDVKSELYLVVNAGNIVPDKTLQHINKAITEGLAKFALIEEDKYYLVPTTMHRFFYYEGDPELNIVENIKEKQKETPNKNMIWTMDQIKKCR